MSLLGILGGATLGANQRARRLVEELKERGIQPDRNLLLITGLREDLMQLHTTQLFWEIGDVEGAAGDRYLARLYPCGIEAPEHQCVERRRVQLVSVGIYERMMDFSISLHNPNSAKSDEV